jgi:ribonuclease HI
VSLAECYPETVSKTVTIYSDNRSVLQAVTDMKATSGQYLIREMVKVINRSQAKASLEWISGHSGVANEMADR